jgi:hemerythrin-like domain-containing protein
MLLAVHGREVHAMARNASQKKEGMFSRMISVVGGGESGEDERSEMPEGGESATTMLKAEHDEVRQLFKEFEGASEGARSSRKRIADEVSQKLEVHAQLEEQIFYPACRNLEDEEARKMVGESLEEHLIVKRLIAELAPLDGSDETFESKFTVLKENVEHHADEEERDLFPVAEKELGDERLEELGMQMAQMKQQLLSGAKGRSGRGGSRGGSSRSGSGSSGSSSERSSRSRGGAQGRGRSSGRGRSGGSQGSRSSGSRSSSRSSSGGSSRSRSSSSGRGRSRSSKKK